MNRISRMVAAFATTACLAAPAHAAQNGPHQIIAYNGHEYAFMKLSHGGGAQFKVFRAVGNNSWEYLGGTMFSNGSPQGRFHRIYFNGRKAGVVHGDLTIPFYQPYSGFGGSDRLN